MFIEGSLKVELIPYEFTDRILKKLLNLHSQSSFYYNLLIEVLPPIFIKKHDKVYLLTIVKARETNIFIISLFQINKYFFVSTTNFVQFSRNLSLPLPQHMP